jgi:hypothetical protein
MASLCQHLAGLTPENCPPQKTPDACEECLTEGTVWVALRECVRPRRLLRFLDGQACDQRFS